MIIKKALTIELDVNEVHLTSDVKKINIDYVMTKYDFSIITHSNDEKLLMIAKELLDSQNILIGFAAYNLEDIIKINNHLKNSNSALDTIFIPSPIRIAQRLAEAKENAKNHSRWIGADETDVERNFTAFKVTLDEIKNGLSKENIKVVEC